MKYVVSVLRSTQAAHKPEPKQKPQHANERTAAALCWLPPIKSPGLEARKFWDQAMSLFERSEFRH